MPGSRRPYRYWVVAFAVGASALLDVFIELAEPKDLGWLGDIAESIPGLYALAIFVPLSVFAECLLWYWNESDEATEFTPRRRADLLHLLKGRYKKRLSDSLKHKTELQLEMQDRPGVLQPNASLRLIGERKDRPLPDDMTVHRLFDETSGRLLILGQPGAGKTTMMLELAEELVERAKEGKEAVPVVVNLASWAKHGGPLQKWLEEEALPDTLNIDSSTARAITQEGDLLLLLDGLDEVKASKRSACIAEINKYLKKHGRMVVCSRTREYEQSAERLELEKAAQIEPLTPETFIQELKRVPKTDGLRAMLRKDDALRELATTPLMWSVMLLAYRGERPSSIQANTLEERRQALWDDYVARMIARRQPTEYEPKNILRWLTWLAERMRQEDMTDLSRSGCSLHGWHSLLLTRGLCGLPSYWPVG